MQKKLNSHPLKVQDDQFHTLYQFIRDKPSELTEFIAPQLNLCNVKLWIQICLQQSLSQPDVMPTESSRDDGQQASPF